MLNPSFHSHPITFQMNFREQLLAVRAIDRAYLMPTALFRPPAILQRSLGVFSGVIAPDQTDPLQMRGAKYLNSFKTHSKQNV